MPPDVTTTPSNAPWWASSATTFYFTLGPSTIILFLFLFMITGWIDSPLSQARDIVMANQALLKEHVEIMKRDHRDQLKMGWALCMNSAKDRSGMDRCQEALQGDQ